jgi:Tol biopolymer transport system component
MYPRSTTKSASVAAFACLCLVAGLLVCFSPPRRARAAGSNLAELPAPHASTSPAPLAQTALVAPSKRVNGKILYVVSSSFQLSDIWSMDADGSNRTNLTNTPFIGESEPSWSPDGAKIVFNRGSNQPESGIYVMNADGSDVRRVTRYGRWPLWSPDGTKIAYVLSLSAKPMAVYVVNVDGSGEVKLTDDQGSQDIIFDLSWSPDGTKFAFYRSRSNTDDAGIWTMNADGSEQKRIISYTAVQHGVNNPEWSPDSAHLVFEGGWATPFATTLGVNIYTSDADGSNIKQLTSTRYNEANYYEPAWSPDGKQIIFRIDYPNGNKDIAVMDADGSHIVNLTNNNSLAEQHPAWQPRIASQNKAVFMSERDGNAEIYVMDSDGGNQINLTKHPAKDATPVWSPDHTQIAFTSDRSGSSNIYVMDADGSNLRAVTNNDSLNFQRVYDPAWSPDGRKLIYVQSENGESSGLFIVNVDGSDNRRFLEGSSEVADPAWSPDGTRIAYVGLESFSNLEAGPHFQLFVINANGSGKTRLNTKEPADFRSFAYPPEASGPAWSPDGSRLVYVSRTDGNEEIYVTGLFGGHQRLTQNAAADTLPAWVSADRISFTSTRDGQRDLYTMPVDGGPAARLTQNLGPNSDADWQVAAAPPARPPSQRIAYVRVNDGNADIYVSHSSGTDAQNITNSPQNERGPAWSPDGLRIAYIRWPERALFVMNADGSGVRRLAGVSDVAIKPAWSPDGTRIAFIGGSDLAYNISVVNLDGTGEQLLIPQSETFSEVAWSPDGKRLAYVRDRFSGFSNPSIGIVNVDGSGERTLTTGDNLDRHPAWSPDGRQIAFARSSRGLPPEIYLMNADGSDQTPVTDEPSTDEMPAWSSDGRTLAFASDFSSPFPEINVVDPATPRQRGRVTQNSVPDYAPDWQPNGGATIQFRNAAFSLSESGRGGEQIVVTRLGDLSHAASVEYSARMLHCGFNSNQVEIICPQSAREGTDYVHPTGKLNFAPGEATQTINVGIIDDGKHETTESLQIFLRNATGATLNSNGAAVDIFDDDAAGAPNPIDEPRFFVRMHYLDFLGREPEQAGWDAWVGVLNGCSNVFNNPLCDRVQVSSAFFRSQEFLSKGYFIYRFYRVALGQRPTYAEFLRDLPLIFGQNVDEINERKDFYSRTWTARADFQSTYNSLTNEQYVGRLLERAGVMLAGTAVTRESLIADLDAGRRTRAETLRAIVEHASVEQALYNEAFVTMQYFGYLKRDPDEGGYQNWLRVINRGDSYRVMVHGFVNSIEYRARFGTP